MITPTIIRGNSGGPILNAASEVISIARTGSDVIGKEVYENAVLPITLVPKLMRELLLEGTTDEERNPAP